MQTSKSLLILLAAFAASCANAVTATDQPRRNLRTQHNGEDHSVQTPSAVASVPFTNDAAQLANDAANNAAQWANSAGQFGSNDWIPNNDWMPNNNWMPSNNFVPNTGVDVGPSPANANLNFGPLSFSRSVDIGPGSVKANVGVGFSLGSPPAAPAAAGATAASAPTTGGVSGGINFNPLTAPSASTQNQVSGTGHH